MEENKRPAFEEAGAEKELSLLAEFIAMMKQNKKWWLIPIIIILLGFGVLIMLGATGAAPFIYTLF